MNQNEASFLGFIKKYMYLVITAIATIILAYGYATVISHELSIDEGLFFGNTTAQSCAIWNSQGRIGISLINLLFMPIFNSIPFFNF